MTIYDYLTIFNTVFNLTLMLGSLAAVFYTGYKRRKNFKKEE